MENGSNHSMENLLDLMVARDYLSAEQLAPLKEQAEQQNRSVAEVLIEQKIISEEDLAKLKAEISNVPYIDLSAEDLLTQPFEEFSQEVCLRYKFVVFKQENNCIFIAVVDPTDMNALEAIKFIALKNNLDWKIFITSETNFKEVIGKYSNISAEVGEALEILKKDTDEEGAGGESKISIRDIERIAQEAPISKVVSSILKHAVDGKASDIHIEPIERSLRVRYRVDGVLYTSLTLAKKLAPAVVARVKVLSNLKLDEQRKPQDGRFNATINSKKIDFRVSTLPTTNGEKVVMRILDKTSGLKKFADLGFSEEGQKILEKSLKNPYGVIMVTGPTGSGKSTTLYSMLQVINEEGINIITLEDPVEYYLEGISQSQIHAEIGYTFASGLRSILRQDPDVIMVGEIRDNETAELATHAALTGHLVFSTLHTNNAVGAIPRMIDMGIEPFLVASSIKMIEAQRLVKRICPHCRQEAEINQNTRDFLLKELEAVPGGKGRPYIEKGLKLFKGAGCKFCNGKGMIGRTSISEIIVMTPELEEIAAKKPTENQVEVEALRQEMVNMKQDGIFKALEGAVALEEVLKVVEV
ncbi:MAG: ATPase, T2SS/T4P/T4SS family [bacterium]